MSALLAGDGRYASFVLAVDDLEWTRHWLGRLRCDQLLVFVATDSSVQPQIRIRAVESKSTSKVEDIDLVAHIEPFAEAIEQLTATLDAISAAPRK